MKRYKIQIEGISPHIQNRLDRDLNKEFKAVPKDKREDWQDANYLRKAYWGATEKDKIIIPDTNVRAMLITACKKYKVPPPRSVGRTWTDYFSSGVLVENVDFSYNGEIKPFCSMVNGNPSSQKKSSKVYSVRPLFEEWGMTFILVDTQEYLDVDNMEGIVEIGGKCVGFSDYRPLYGRFKIKKVQVV